MSDAKKAEKADPRDELIAELKARLDRIEAAGAPPKPPDGMDAMSAADMMALLRRSANPQAFLAELGTQEHEAGQAGIRALEAYHADRSMEAEALAFLKKCGAVDPKHTPIVVNDQHGTDPSRRTHSTAYFHDGRRIRAATIDLAADRDRLRPLLGDDDGPAPALPPTPPDDED